jgi:hypothetical protein
VHVVQSGLLVVRVVHAGVYRDLFMVQLELSDLAELLARGVVVPGTVVFIPLHPL